MDLNTKSKPLPPYGQKLKRFLNTGAIPKNNVWVFFGAGAWQKAEVFNKHKFALCLPYEAQPESYFWPVTGCHPLVIDTGGAFEADIVRRLAYLLLASGAVKVNVILFDLRQVVYCKHKEAKE